jgi:hypothetical protein
MLYGEAITAFYEVYATHISRLFEGSTECAYVTAAGTCSDHWR